MLLPRLDTKDDAQRARVKKALELDPSLVGKIRDGQDAHVSVEQNNVLRAFADQVGGMSVQQLRDTMDKPGVDAAVFAEGLNDIMNGHLKCAVPDPARPDQQETSYGPDLAPASVKDAFASSGAHGDPLTDPRYRPKMDDLQALAGIVARVPDGQLAGSGLTKGALVSAADLARCCGPERGFLHAPPQAQGLLETAGRDTMAVHDAAMDPKSGTQFVDSLERAKWQDGGAALAGVTNNVLKEAEVGGGVSEAQAHRAGQTEHQFFSALAANKDSVDPHGPFAKSMTDVAEKYMPSLFGAELPGDHTRGFGFVDVGPDNDTYPKTKETLEFLSQDEEGSTKIGHQMAVVKSALVAEYAEAARAHPGHMSEADAGVFRRAGIVDGVMDRIAGDLAHDDAQRKYEIKSRWFDNGKDSATAIAGLLGLAPGAEAAGPLASGLVAVGFNDMKATLLGPSPGDPGMPGPHTSQTMYSVAAALPPDAHAVRPEVLSQLFNAGITDRNGAMKSWDEIQAMARENDSLNRHPNRYDVRDALSAYLGAVVTPSKDPSDSPKFADRGEYESGYELSSRK